MTDCLETLKTLTMIRKDLRGYLLPNVDAELFTDGSRYIKNEIRYVKATVTQDQILCTKALTHVPSGKNAELLGLTQAL